MFYFLPKELNRFAIKNLNALYELRIRLNKPVVACIGGKYITVIQNGEQVVLNERQIEEVVCKACENSIYSYNENIKNGYIACNNGIRIGIGGECVCVDGQVHTIKKFTSLCIRIPHEVIGCGTRAYSLIKDQNSIKNTLIASPPGIGKTTLLRDLVRLISDFSGLNVAVIDEKNELWANNFDLGSNTDVIRGCKKSFGFNCAIKYLSPQVIATDELSCADDVEGVVFAANSGVKIICTIHGKNISEVKSKHFFIQAVKSNCFDRFIVLNRDGSSVYISEFD